MSRDDTSAAQPRSPELLAEPTTGMPSHLTPVSSDRSPAEVAGFDRIRIALIDAVQFSQDCLIRAFNAIHPDLLITPFDSVSACLQADRMDPDVILYCTHDDGLSEQRTLQCVADLREKFASTPVVVLSDSKAALQPRSIRNALKCGARGFIPTLNTQVPAVLAALRFVKEGGTFAPLDLLLPGKAGHAADKTLPTDELTARQKAVMLHLKQGKANKIIAYELGMTESTVKVHIRNIMRKMGATNRTQAVYKSQMIPVSY